MGIIMAAEYAAFEREQNRLQKWYRENGMSEDQIRELYIFDRAQLNRDIAYWRRSTPLVLDDDMGNNREDENLHYAGGASCEIDFEQGLELLDQIENEQLLKALKKLSLYELWTIEEILVGGKRVSDFSREYGIPQSTVNCRLRRIKNKLKRQMLSAQTPGSMCA